MICCCRAVKNEKINPRKSGTAEEVTNLPTRTFPKVEEKRVNDNKLGMEVVPIELRDAYAFGGGLHCCTADVYREGKLQDYFPKQ